jgi:hypothetical protein
MQNTRTLVALCATALAMTAATTAAAQARQGGGAQATDRTRSATQTHDQQTDRTRDVAQDRARDAIQDRDRDRDTAQDRDRDRDRDSTKLRDRDRVRDTDIYGAELMSVQERDQYRQQLQSAKNDQEWARLRAQHEEQMRERAKQRGVNLPAPVYGQHMLTAQETERYRRRIDNARDEQARAQVRAEHEEMVRERARELGLEAPPRS